MLVCSPSPCVKCCTRTKYQFNPKQKHQAGSLTPRGASICTTKAVILPVALAMNRQARYESSDEEDSDLNSNSGEDDASEDIGSQDTEDDDESDDDSVGSLDQFVTDEIVPMAPEERHVSEVSTANIIVGKRTRRPAPKPYQDPDFMRLMLDDVPKDEIAVALGVASASSSDSDDASFRAEEDSDEASYQEEDDDGSDEEDEEEENDDDEDEEPEEEATEEGDETEEDESDEDEEM